MAMGLHKNRNRNQVDAVSNDAISINFLDCYLSH